MPPLTWTNFAPPFSRDLAYLAENGLLKVSVRLYGALLEQGSYEVEDDRQWFTIPEDRSPFHGLQDLSQLVGDTDQGRQIRQRIRELKELIEAYRTAQLKELL